MPRASGAAVAANYPGWMSLGLFALCVTLLGGSSRTDVVQIAVLRPLCALFLVPALYWMTLASLRRCLTPAILLALLALWMALQLMPLSPSVWASLPDREVVAQIDHLAGQGDIWRPLSMAPFRGWNALFSLLVPAAALALALAMRVSSREIMIIVVGMGFIDAVFGLVQVVGGASSPLYLFSITSLGAPAGVYANENHSAVFSALVLLVIARLAITSHSAKEPAWLKLAYAAAYLGITLAILVSGSRAGFAAGLFAVSGTAVMAWLGRPPTHGKSRGTNKAANGQMRAQRLALPAFFLFTVLTIALFLWVERTPAFRDLFAQNAFEDLRLALWPTLQAMADTHWLLGTGFGSFDAVYNIYEPTSLLLPRYVNQAHNDWVQLVIEGGAPAVLLLFGYLIWQAFALKALWSSKGAYMPVLLVFWFSLLVIISAASVVDYPLRTPIFQVLLVWMAYALSNDGRGEGAL
jgi:O-antigen ligase